MKQIIRLTYWYHVVNYYHSIEDCVNSWLEQHLDAELLDAKFTVDYTFFKGPLYEAILTVKTPKRIDDDFDCFKPNEEAEKRWDEMQDRLYPSPQRTRKTIGERLRAAWRALV